MNDENDSMENSKLYQELSELFNRADPTPSSNVHHPSSIEFQTPPTTSGGALLDNVEMTRSDVITPRTILDNLKEEEQVSAHNHQTETPTEIDVSPLGTPTSVIDDVEQGLMLLNDIKYSEENLPLITIIDATAGSAQYNIKAAFNLLVLRVMLYNTVKFVNIKTLWALLYLLSTLLSEEYRTYFSIVRRIDSFLTEAAHHHEAYEYPTVDTI